MHPECRKKYATLKEKKMEKELCHIKTTKTSWANLPNFIPANPPPPIQDIHVYIDLVCMLHEPIIKIKIKMQCANICAICTLPFAIAHL